MRDELGDLAVTLRQLRDVPTPPHDQSRLATFAAWYAYGERLFHQTIATGLVVERAGRAPTVEELAPLVLALDDAPAEALFGQCSVAFEYIGYEIGYFYGGAPWDRLCQWRSAGLFLETLGQRPIDMSVTDEGLAQWGHELYEPLEVPSGMPPRHWWWFSATPP